MNWELVVFWLGVAMQIVGFALQWKRLNDVMAVLNDLDRPPQPLSGQMFRNDPTFGGASSVTEAEQIDRLSQDVASGRAEAEHRSNEKLDHLTNSVRALNTGVGADRLALVLFAGGLILSSIFG